VAIFEAKAVDGQVGNDRLLFLLRRAVGSALTDSGKIPGAAGGVNQMDLRSIDLKAVDEDLAVKDQRHHLYADTERCRGNEGLSAELWVVGDLQVSRYDGPGKNGQTEIAELCLPSHRGSQLFFDQRLKGVDVHKQRHRCDRNDDDSNDGCGNLRFVIHLRSSSTADHALVGALIKFCEPAAVPLLSDVMLILASASPRRHELLSQAGVAFTAVAAGINEDLLPNEAAAAYVQRLAEEKAQAIWNAHRAADTSGEPLLVLGADTCVVCDGHILGKPTDTADARRMLELLSGRTHAVLTGLAVVAGRKIVRDLEITQVTFNCIDDAEIAQYIASGEPLDKAGAYAIQGYAARWIPRIEGCYFNVVGLPIARTIALLVEAQTAPAGDK
jgi:septum formation protein